jgi:hypothetical protein
MYVVMIYTFQYLHDLKLLAMPETISDDQLKQFVGGYCEQGLTCDFKRELIV